MSGLPEPGSRAPAFTLTTDEGDVISLRDLRGSPVVLYFYPKDDTSGCTVQACEFRDSWPDVEAAGAVVLGVSPDPVKSHVRFRRKYDLPFPLLADTDHAVAEAYGVWGEKMMFGNRYHGIHRTTFLIGPDARVAHVFERVKPEGHAGEVLAVLARLQEAP